MTNLIVIDNEVVEVTDVQTDIQNGCLIECDNGHEYYVFTDRDAAGEGARQHWQDMVDHDKEEFKEMVGTECLISWCLGEWAGPGSTQVQSLEEWLDLHLDCPEEHFASYDGEEIEGIQCNNNLLKDLDMDFTNGNFTDKSTIILYRCN